MVSPNNDWEKYRPFSVCISWYMPSKTFSFIMLFVKKRLYLTYQKCSISFSLTFWNMLFVWYVRRHCANLTRGTQRLLSVVRSKYWGRLKLSVAVPFMYNFRSLSNKFTTIFWSLIFQILLPRLGYFLQNCHFRTTLNCIYNFLEKILQKSL